MRVTERDTQRGREGQWERQAKQSHPFLIKAEAQKFFLFFLFFFGARCFVTSQQGAELLYRSRFDAAARNSLRLYCRLSGIGPVDRRLIPTALRWCLCPPFAPPLGELASANVKLFKESNPLLRNDGILRTQSVRPTAGRSGIPSGAATLSGKMHENKRFTA